MSLALIYSIIFIKARTSKLQWVFQRRGMHIILSIIAYLRPLLVGEESLRQFLRDLDVQLLHRLGRQTEQDVLHAQTVV